MNPESFNYVIVVAGGSGIRMGTALPKQFLLLQERPVLMYTLEAFERSAAHPNIILVLHPDYHKYWKSLCIEYNFTTPYQLVAGGETRFHSVKNGLVMIPDKPGILVAVQDAVRPLTSKMIIDQSYDQAAINGNAITAVKSRDSIRQLKNGVALHVLRDEIYLIQTPQTFEYSQLRKAYETSFYAGFTDDASVVENAGFAIHITEGSYENIKITFPEDIVIAEALLKKARN